MRVLGVAGLCVAALACSSADDHEEFEEALELIKQELDNEGQPTDGSAAPATVSGDPPAPEPEPEPVAPVPAGVEVKGGLQPEEVHRVVTRYRTEVDECYREELAENPSVSGGAKLRWVISATGDVERVKVRKTSIDIVNVAECLRASIKSWKFPKPSDGGVVVVDYPFSFQPS